MTSRVGRDIGVTTKWIAMSNLKKYEISQYKNSKVIRIAKDGMDIEYLNPEKEGESPEVKHIGADAVVLAAGSARLLTPSQMHISWQLQSKYLKIQMFSLQAQIFFDFKKHFARHLPGAFYFYIVSQPHGG